MSSILDDLNASQLQAVTHEHGPLLIVAGAGTGKTTVIARHIVWKLQHGLKTNSILALTFTDKAANEMVERVESQLTLGYSDFWISTFHAFCQKILENHAIDIGLPPEFKLLNETDAYLLMRKNFDKFDLKYYRPLGNPTKFIHALVRHFLRAKDEAITPSEYLEYAKNVSLNKDNPAFDADEQSRLTEIATAYNTYQKVLIDNNALDLGDLMFYTIQLFKKRPNILKKYRDQFKEVIIDEFQDTNIAQYELIKLLVPPNGNLIVVGDDDQAIYKFRGASVSNILQFKQDFPQSKEIFLTQNYRSRQNILNLAYKFIQKNNPNRLEIRLEETAGTKLSKHLVANQEGTGIIEHLQFRSIDDEIHGVVKKIVATKEAQQNNWSDFAVLSRSNSSGELIARECERQNIPYQFMALKGLYAKPIILDIVAYLKCLIYPHDSVSMYRILSSLYKLPGADIAEILHTGKRKTDSLFYTAQNHLLLEKMTADGKTILDKFLVDFKNHSEVSKNYGVVELVTRVIFDSGIIGQLSRVDDVRSRENISFIEQFLKRLKRFEEANDSNRLYQFLADYEIEIESGEEGSLNFDPETGPDMVKIMTIHAAKGLEFPYVFVTSMVEKKFPGAKRGGEIDLPAQLTKEIIYEGDEHIEEERRLAYVAITRAKTGLFFSSAEDYGGKLKRKPSRFLEEMGFIINTDATNLKGDAKKVVLKDYNLVENQTVKPTPARLPPYLSYTQLAAYDKCPLQYKFAHILRIPIFGKPQFSFGKTIHASLERFMNLYIDKLGLVQTNLFGGTESDKNLPSKEELLAIYDAAWHDDWYDDRESKEKYRDHGRKLLTNFYVDFVKQPPNTLYLEQDFKVRIGDVWIRGKIDRIDRNADGSVEIIDYKTGSPKGESIRAEDKKQLILYQIAVGQNQNLKTSKLTYYYLEDGSRLSFTAEASEVEKFEQSVLDTVAKIRSNNFTATPGMHCNFCDFAKICDFKKT